MQVQPYPWRYATIMPVKQPSPIEQQFTQALNYWWPDDLPFVFSQVPLGIKKARGGGECEQARTDYGVGVSRETISPYCHPARVWVELDGEDWHLNIREDQSRMAVIEAMTATPFVRFTGYEVRRDARACVEKLARIVRFYKSPTLPANVPPGTFISPVSYAPLEYPSLTAQQKSRDCQVTVDLRSAHWSRRVRIAKAQISRFIPQDCTWSGYSHDYDCTHGASHGCWTRNGFCYLSPDCNCAQQALVKFVRLIGEQQASLLSGLWSIGRDYSEHVQYVYLDDGLHQVLDLKLVVNDPPSRKDIPWEKRLDAWARSNQSFPEGADDESLRAAHRAQLDTSSLVFISSALEG